MPRQVGASVENNFVKGLITEATGLNFPENACTDALNVRFSQTGEVSRREGLNYELDFQEYTFRRNGIVITEYVWEAVAGTGNINFVVVQLGRILHFYQIPISDILSAHKKSFTVDLSDFDTKEAPNTREYHCQFTSGKGLLFVAHPFCDPFYVEYDPQDDEITVTALELKVRDIKGVDDNLPVDERPSTLSNEHHYNLWNQGWYTAADFENEGHQEVDTIGNFHRVAGVYPSNADIWWLYKNEFEAYKPGDLLNSFQVGNTPAPKGHYILDAFFEDRSAQEGTALNSQGNILTTTIPGLPVVTSKGFRPTTIAFFAGRAWYAGVNTQKYNSKIWYSQIALDDLEKLEQCYQQNDPSAEDLSDLLDTDGGVIEIQEIGNVVKLFPMKNALLVFASNGVWAISGTQDSGFTATDFQINKISSVPTLSSLSFIDIFGTPIWWNLDGIYSIVSDEKGLTAKNLTDSTIKTYYDDIPGRSKKYAKGAFNQLTKEIQWVFSSEAADNDDIDSRYIYDSILCLNTLTGAFYPFTINTDTAVNLNGIISIRGTGTERVAEDVIDENDDIVTATTGGAVTAIVTQEELLSSVFKYLVSRRDTGSNYKFSWAQERDDTHRDWRAIAGEEILSYNSYFVTGYKIRGNALAYGQIPYLVVYSRTFQNSSCYLQVLWDYARSTDSNRIGRFNQIYRHDTNYEFLQTRIKLRGKGRSVQLKFSSDTTKPFKIIGWSTFETINTVP